MRKVISKKTGKEITLLNPSERGGKFVNELLSGYPMTNKGEYKADKNGVVEPLTDEQRAFRSGYLTAQKDSANAYKSRKKRGK